MSTPRGTPTRRPVARAILRGVHLRCPACGKGQLFKAYLKPVADCAACGEDLSHIRAEDGPSWLTILLLGPVLLPATLLATLFLTGSHLPGFVVLPLVLGAIVGAVLLALPRVKGGFIGALWSLQVQSGRRAP